MKTLVSCILLWAVLSAQSFAAVMFPTAVSGGGEHQAYIVELKSLGYFYKLNVYDSDDVLVASTIQFARGDDLDTFVIAAEDGQFEVMVVMTMGEATDAYDAYIFDGQVLNKLAS